MHLWRHEHHTFHLKGLLVDEDYALLTGNNLNPRAWRMDLENGLLIHDPHKAAWRGRTGPSWSGCWRTPGAWIDYRALEAVEDYPAPARRLLKRLARARVDRLVNQVL